LLAPAAGNANRWLLDGVYGKDYYVTLLELLKIVLSENLPQGIENPYAQATRYRTSQFLAFSPIDPSIFYIKILLEENTVG
jgi:hypothetical protein